MQLAELAERTNMASKLVASRVPAYDYVLMSQSQLGVQHVEHAANYRLPRHHLRRELESWSRDCPYSAF